MTSSVGRAHPGGHPAPEVARLAMVMAALWLAVAAPLSAQVGVDRLTLVFRATPGESRLGVLSIRNNGPEPVQAVIRLEDWDRSDDGSNRWHPLGTTAGSCGEALDIFPPAVTLAPGESQALRVTLDSIANPTRQCWSAAIIETPEPRTESGVAFRLRTAVKIYVEPPGLELRGEVASLEVSTDSTTGVEMVFHNTGGRHLEGKGQLQVRTAENTVVRTIDLPVVHVLPGARGRVRTPLPDLPPGRYVLLAVVDYGGNELAAAQLEHHVP